MNKLRASSPSRSAAMPHIPASALTPIRVLYDGDVAELALLMAKLDAALAVRVTAASTKTRVERLPTVHGVSRKYADLTGIPIEIVKAAIAAAGIPLAACIIVDEESP